MSLSNAEKITRASVGLVSIVVLAGCSLGQDVRYNRHDNNKSVESPPNYAVAYMRQDTVPMGEKKFWWSEQDRQCGAYKTNLPWCYLQFAYTAKDPRRYTAGNAGNWAKFETSISFRKESKNTKRLPDELKQAEATALITQSGTSIDAANLALRVAEYSICRGGQVRLSHDNGERISGPENMEKLLTAKDVSQAVSEIDPANVEKIEAVEQGRNGGWIVRLECSLWRDGRNIQKASNPAQRSQTAAVASDDLRDHVDALLNAQ